MSIADVPGIVRKAPPVGIRLFFSTTPWGRHYYLRDEGTGRGRWWDLPMTELQSGRSATRGISCRYWASPGYPTYVRAGGPQRNSEIATVTSILQMWEWTGSKSHTVYWHAWNNGRFDQLLPLSSLHGEPKKWEGHICSLPKILNLAVYHFLLNFWGFWVSYYWVRCIVYKWFIEMILVFPGSQWEITKLG